MVEPMATKPYRDDPESASGSLTFRRTSENSPVMELEMRPMQTGKTSSRPSILVSMSKRCSAKMLWCIFVVMVGIYAISRYDAQPQESKVQQGLSTTTTPTEPEAAIEATESHSKPVAKPPPSSSTICSRKIPFDLFDTSTWPTPYTPYYQEPPTDAQTAILIQNAIQMKDKSNRIRAINELFSALDMAYEENCQLYITKTASWIWNSLIPPFFGDRVDKNDEFWEKIQDALGVIILNDEAEAQSLGLKLKVFTPKQLYAAKNLSAEQLRNRRDTIFRKLMRLTPSTTKGDACFTIDLCGLSNINSYHYSTNYIVIDLSPSISKKWQSKFNDISGRDHSGAYQMTPEYVKSILKPLKLHTKMIFMMGDHSVTDDEEIKRLMEDPELRTQQAVEEDDDYDHSDMLHLAVLADVYLADPTSQWSLMIARMRYALGFKNTFVLTEPKVDENGYEYWVSYVDSEHYLELYDRAHLGPWMG